QLAGGSACPTCCIVGGPFRSIPVLGKRSQAAPQIGGLRLVDPSPRQTEPGGAADRRPETRRSHVHEDPPAPLDEPTSRPRANLRPPTATPIAQPSRCGRSLRPTSPYTSVSRAARRLVQGLIELCDEEPRNTGHQGQVSGTMDIDLTADPLGQDPAGQPVFLRDIWPTNEEVAATVRAAINRGMFEHEYAHVFDGDKNWQSLSIPEGGIYQWDDTATYIKKPPYFDNMVDPGAPLQDFHQMRVLALLGDSVTTDHISPAGSIPKDGPAGKYLMAQGVQPGDFNSFGARRGNHEVMVRGTLANIRLRNQLAPGTEGGVTRHLPDGEQRFIYDASMQYQKEGVPLLIVAGKEYGSGSSRDWAAKGVLLLGVRAVIAESFERIHRTNLVGMSVLPLEFQPGENAASLQVKAPVLPIRVSEGSAPTQLIRAQSKSTRPQRCSSWSGCHPPGGFAPTNAIHAANVLRNEGSRVACARTEGRGVEVES